MQEHSLLILGAGWTSTFLIPILRTRGLPFAATTRDGRTVADYETIKWTFNPESSDAKQFEDLPLAKNVLITFPLTGHEQTKTLVEGYTSVWKGKDVRFIQLGSTGIWQIPQSSIWTDRHSPHNKDDSRAMAEDELLDLNGCVLNLAGLWGGERQPRTWVGRVAKTKEDVKKKTSLHMIHGEDVARAIVAVTENWKRAGKGQRWMVTDGFVYDWWSLMAGWAAEKQAKDGEAIGKGDPNDYAKWVYQLMVEEDVKALPRNMEALGRCYDTREFWKTIGIVPLRARMI